MNKVTWIAALAMLAMVAQENASAETSKVKAAENTQSISVDDLTKDAKKIAPGEDKADQVITNRYLRAATGSLSKWSFTSEFALNGGSINKPLDPMRPNIKSQVANKTALQSIVGSMGVKYRLTELDSLRFGAGIRMYSPFQRSYRAANAKDQARFDTYKGRTDVFDPTIAYTRLFNVGSTQNVLDISQSYVTDPETRDLGYAASTAVGHTIIYQVKNTNLSLGHYFLATYTAFDRKATTPAVIGGEQTTLAGTQTDYSLGFYPYIEYVINDTLNFRTLTGIQYEHTRDIKPLAWNRNKVYQSVGLGITVTRDIFLYPNVQFIPDQISADKTNVAVVANINLF